MKLLKFCHKELIQLIIHRVQKSEIIIPIIPRLKMLSIFLYNNYRKKILFFPLNCGKL